MMAEGNDGTSPEDQTAVDSLTATTNAAKEAMMGESLDVDAELEDGMMAPGPEPMMADDRARMSKTVVRRPIAPGPTVRRTTVVGKRHLLGDDDDDEEEEDENEEEEEDEEGNDGTSPEDQTAVDSLTATTNAAKEAMMG